MEVIELDRVGVLHVLATSVTWGFWDVSFCLTVTIYRPHDFLFALCFVMMFSQNA